MRKTLLMLWVVAGCGGPPAGGDKDAGPTVHGCKESDFVDRSDTAASRSIAFGTAQGSPALGYTPKCMTISAGQSVEFIGNFNTHPLVGGEFGVTGAASPIGRHVTGSDPVTVQLTTAGDYAYYCDYHAPTMVGVVRVK